MFFSFCLCFSSKVESAPVPSPGDIPEELQIILDSQPELSSKNWLSVTPGVTLAQPGDAVFYAVGADLSERLTQSAMAAGYEVGHTALLAAVLKLSVLLNPVVPIHGPLALGINSYLFLRVMLARAFLAWRLAAWGKDALVRTVWPDHRFISIDLSSRHSGTVVGELTIPLKADKAIELNVYTDGVGSDEPYDCQALPYFDCFVRVLKDAGVYQWQMQLSRGEYEIKHQFFHIGKSPFSTTTFNARSGPEKEERLHNELHDTAKILSVFLSKDTILPVLQKFLPLPFVDLSPEQATRYGQHSAWIPLGCAEMSECSGLYLAEITSMGEVSSRRLVLPGEQDPDQWFYLADKPGTGSVLLRTSRLYRISGDALTIAFEILEELIEELGYLAGNYLTGLFSSSSPTTAIPDKSPPLKRTDISTEAIPPQDKEDTPGYYLMQLATEGDPGQLDTLEQLAGYADVDHIERAFERALATNHLEHAEKLFEHLSSEYLEDYLKRMARNPWLVELKKIAPMLDESLLAMILSESVQHDLEYAVKVLQPHAPEDMLSRFFLEGAACGKESIVRLLMAGRSHEVLINGLQAAHKAGFTTVCDCIFEVLPSSVVGDWVPETIFREYFIHMARAGTVGQISELWEKAPKAIESELIELLKRHGNAENRQYGLRQEYSKKMLKVAMELVSANEQDIFRRHTIVMNSSDKRKCLDQMIEGQHRPFISILFSSFPVTERVSLLISLAEQGRDQALMIMMGETDSVIRDQALMETVKRHSNQRVIQSLAERSSLSSIYRASILAAKSGLLNEAAYLKTFLPEEVALKRGLPVYHLDEDHKANNKELLRERRNQQFGRIPLGEKFYVYQNSGQVASKAYVVAHGVLLRNKPAFLHKGNYYIQFMSKDDHAFCCNHLKLFLERDFRIQQTVCKGGFIKPYGLVKNYNSGWAFKHMPGGCGACCGDLLERKSAPFVLSAVRKYFAENGEDMDFITVRSKKKVRMKTLLKALNKSTEFNYRQVIMGCCRGDSMFAPTHYLSTRLTHRYLAHGPEIFMKVYTSLKVHPAFWDDSLWEYFHPAMDNPEDWLATMAGYKDAMVEGAWKEFKAAREAIVQYSRATSP